ncbi:MAG: hypothetical protein QOI92_1040, partial [Chloroflexota bacterium]|nr:hypothetical protein [Chloroflexota bacterium]
MIRRDRDPLDDERAAARLTTEPVRPPIDEDQLASALGVVIALLAVLILKPWTGGTPEPSRFVSVASAAPATATPIPTEDRTADGLAIPVCLGSGAWRVASLETWQTQDVRVWRAIEPIADTTGPLDPAIPSVPIVAIELTALGWCAPAYGTDKPVGPAIVTAWTIHDGEALPLQLRQVRPAHDVTPIAALYVPLTLCPNPPGCAPPPPPPPPPPPSTPP